MYSVVLATLLTAGGSGSGGQPISANYHLTCFGSYGSHGSYACVSGVRAPTNHCAGIGGRGGHGGHSSHFSFGIGISFGSGAGAGNYPSSGHVPNYHHCSTCVVAVPVVVPQVVVVQSPPQIVVVPSPPREQKSASARVIVTLPSDARMWIDGVECPLTSGVRTIVTPPLNPAQIYHYTLRIEMVRNGRPVSQSQRVQLYPGDTARADFTQAGVGH